MAVIRWRVSAERKAELEQAAERAGQTVDAVLDSLATEWLRRQSPNEEATRTETATALVEEARALAARKGAADAARGEALLAVVAQSRPRGRSHARFYEAGAALREILESELYRALGAESFDGLLETRRVVGRTQAFKLIEIARAFTAEQAVKLGMEKAYALARYTKATPEDDDPGAIASSGKLGARKLATLGRRAIDEAAKAARSRTRRGRRGPRR